MVGLGGATPSTGLIVATNTPSTPSDIWSMKVPSGPTTPVAQLCSSLYVACAKTIPVGRPLAHGSSSSCQHPMFHYNHICFIFKRRINQMNEDTVAFFLYLICTIGTQTHCQISKSSEVDLRVCEHLRRRCCRLRSRRSSPDHRRWWHFLRLHTGAH